ncbi:MAG: TonB-dependent receptor domain-containing protein [Terriglobia bacterium]
MKSKLSRAVGAICAASVLLLAFSAGIFAQVSTGTITGRVTDPSGAPVPAATVTITEQNTSVAVKTATATNGDYSVPLLKPGLYSVRVSARGFQPALRSNLTLQVQATVEADFQLQLGRVSQEVNVVSTGAPVLQTSSSEVGTVVNMQTTQELPLNGRNFSQLALLAPGTNGGEVGSVRQTGGGNETQRAGASIVSNGGRGSFDDYLIDGLDDRDQSVGTIKVFPLVEDIQEFKVETSNYDAEFASGGAVVNVITRSGSNQLHGSAFEFLRNSGLDARQFFDTSVPKFRQNQFGFSLGGPIRKDKTFFFGDYQGFYINQASTVIDTVPTALERGGDFSDIKNVIYDPSTYNPATNTRQPFIGNLIPPGRISAQSQRILAVYPLPNLPGVANNFTFTPLEVTRQNQFDVRIDHTISERDSFFARVTDGTATVRWPNAAPLVNGKINPLAYMSLNRANNAPSTQATWQETHDFTPTLINQFALGYTRFGLSVFPPDQGENTATKLGIAGANTSGIASSMTSLDVSGLTGIGPARAVPEVVPQNTWQLNDTVAYVRGAHSVKFGFQGIHNIFGFAQLGQLNGELAFTGIYTTNPASPSGTGDGFAQYVLGLPNGSSKGVYLRGVPEASYSEIGTFLQDQWRIRPKFTLNWGVRYDIFTPPVEKYNRQSDFDPATGQIILAGQNGVSRSIVDTQHGNVSPRVGFAYTPTAKTVIRGAYGLFYFNEQGTGGSARLFIANPFASTFSVSCSATAPCLQVANGVPPITSGVVSPTAVYIPTGNQTANVQQWNVTVQRQLGANTSLQAAYIGNKGTHLNIALNPDTAFPGPGPVLPREPWPAYSSISAWEPVGNSSYNGLQLSAEKRMSNGLWLLAAYTWSKSLDDGGGGNSNDSEGRSNVQNPRDIAAEYGLSDFDYSSRFTLGHLYQLPVGRGKRFLGNASGIQEAFLGGWDLRGILTLQTGAPFSLSMSTSTANTGTGQYPNRVCNGNLPASQQNINRWFNTACFAAPPLYQFGNAGRNILIGPRLSTYDFALAKDFRLNERFGLTFRTEVFNIFNSANFDIPNASIGSRSAGTITGVVTNAREIQFGLRLHW